MDVIAAHNLISCRSDFGRSLLPEDIDIEAVDGLEPMAALATAAISLSGMMEDAETDADLDEAAEHFRSLLSAGIFTVEQWSQEAESVIRQFLEWGEQQGLEP